MSMEKIYDGVAKNYNQSLSSDVLDQANYIAFNYAANHLNLDASSILALGIGDGAYVEPYQKKFPASNIVGLDISSSMLKRAYNRLGCQTYHGDITLASDIIQNQQFELIIAHFVCAYVRPEVIFKQSNTLLSPGGSISIVSNTLQSFPKLYNVYETYIEQNSFISRRLKRHVDRTLAEVYVPNELTTLAWLAKEYDFDILQHEDLLVDVYFETAESFYEFFMEGGWFASGLMHSYFSPRLIKEAFNWLINRYMHFPFSDTLSIAVVTVKKTGDLCKN